MNHSAFHRGRLGALAPAAALLLALCLLAVGVQAMTDPVNTTGLITGAVSAPVAVGDTGAPAIDWQRCLGGTQADSAAAVQQTADGGYIVAGYTYSKDGDVTGYHGGTNQYGSPLADAWVVKLNTAGGKVWQRCLGGTGGDSASAVQQTADGGFIVAGGTSSNDGDVTGNHGSTDAWVVKLNATGAVIWQKCLGGSGGDTAKAVQLTADGGYIVAGSTESTDGDVTGSHGGYGDSAFDAWVVKLNATGGLVWQKCLGGSDRDGANAVQQTADGGYFVAGITVSTDGDVTGNHGSSDAWVMKLNATGDPVWQRCLGGTSYDEVNAVQQTGDGGYIVAGETRSADGDVTGNHGGYGDFWVVKLDATGSIVWQKCLGGSGEDIARAIQQTADGGYLVSGSTQSTNGDVSGLHGGYGYTPIDVWVVKLDATGGLVWQKCLGGSSSDWAFAARQTADGGYVIAGETYSTDGDVTGFHGDYVDVWVVKLGAVLVPPTTKPPVDDPPATGYETPIVVRDDDQVGPVINGSRVVWQDWRNGARAEGDIYSYDLASHLELPEGAASSDYGKFVPDDYDPAVSGAGIFWVYAGRSDADINNEVRGRTLAGETLNITTGGPPGYRIIRDLAIDGNSLVYVLGERGVIRYDTAHGGDYFVRQTTNEIRSPDVSGGTVVWQEYDGNDWNIFWYTPQGQTLALANDPWDQVAPAVDGTRVVWADHRSGNWDLYTADLSQPNPVGVPLIVAPGDQTNPQLSGDRVIWQDNRNGDWDIYMESLPGGAVATVCTAPGDQRLPAIDGDRIVWEDKRNGNWDIYMFTVSSTGPVPVPTPAPLVITSPGTYAIGADGYDGKNTPIEIRSSNVVLDGGNHTVDGSSQSGSCGVRIAGPLSNVVVRNLRLTNWETGIRAEAVTGSVIENSEISHNHQGIILNTARDVRVRDNRVTANDLTGIVVQNSANTTVHANDISKTGDGFEHIYSASMDLDTFAIVVSSSDGTEISSNDLGGEFGSLDLAGATATRVTGNQLTGRRVGIFSLSRSEATLVVDNVFRNFYNVYGQMTNATWNTTRSPGPNIVGGPSIGGNFWANPGGTGFSETHPDANRDGFVDTPFDNGWGGTDYLPLTVWNGPAPGPTPYSPLSVPGRIQAEDYNLGGENVAYHDTTPGNTGGAYRHDDVDIETASGIANVGWIRTGEYLLYTVNVAETGDYAVAARVATPNTGCWISFSVDNVQGTVLSLPKTGSFETYTTATRVYYTGSPHYPLEATVTMTPTPEATGFPPSEHPLRLTAGTHVLKLEFKGDGQNLDWFELTPYVEPTTPPAPTGPGQYRPLALPGTIQAEDYNTGGEGVAYHDTTPDNEGGAYRHDGVDIETANGITNVGWIRNGEWMTYTANVTTAGTYTMTARVASPNSGRILALTVDQSFLTSITVPNTGSFDAYRTVDVPMTLVTGQHTIKLAFFGDGQNLDWIAFGTGPTPPTTTTTTPMPSGGASFTAAPLTASHGSAVKFTVTPASGKTIGSAWWSFDAPAHLNTWNSRVVNPTFFYPSAGTFSPLVKITYTDGSTETVQRAGYIHAT